MYYCKKCRAVNETAECALCGQNALNAVTEDDLVFVIGKEAIWAPAAEELFAANDIPYVKKANYGAGLSALVGRSGEYYQFLVPYYAYEKAAELFSEG